MVRIVSERVGIEFPVYSIQSLSLKTSLLKFSSVGSLNRDESGAVLVNALRDLNFNFSTGDRIGLIGQNGSGKSTLLRMLSGVFVPTKGRLIIEGKTVSLIDLSLGIDNESTGRESIYLRGALLGLGKKKIREHLDDIIEFADLGEFIDLPVRTYSSGMHLRLAFSLSTIITPEILLMDEWLSVGDEDFKHKAEARLAELVDSTKILVIASHSPDLIMKTCNRVLWLEHGMVKMDGAPSEVCKAYFG